jgi:hypothetical protein
MKAKTANSKAKHSKEVASNGCSLRGVETKERKRKREPELVLDDKAELGESYKEQEL